MEGSVEKKVLDLILLSKHFREFGVRWWQVRGDRQLLGESIYWLENMR